MQCVILCFIILFFLPRQQKEPPHISRCSFFLVTWSTPCKLKGVGLQFFSDLTEPSYFFAWLTFNTNSLAMCQRLNHNFSAFDFSFLFMATFKVLESLLSALNILFLPLITNFSPLPARVFPFSNQRDIILHLDLWIQNYAKDFIIVAHLQKESNDLIAINGSCWDKSLKFKSS